MSTAPIHVHGLDPHGSWWIATREGEPSFAAVQDLEDLYSAALTRECAIVMSDEVWVAMNDGLNASRPSDVGRPEQYPG